MLRNLDTIHQVVKQNPGITTYEISKVQVVTVGYGTVCSRLTTLNNLGILKRTQRKPYRGYLNESI